MWLLCLMLHLCCVLSNKHQWRSPLVCGALILCEGVKFSRTIHLHVQECLDLGKIAGVQPSPPGPQQCPRLALSGVWVGLVGKGAIQQSMMELAGVCRSDEYLFLGLCHHGSRERDSVGIVLFSCQFSPNSPQSEDARKESRALCAFL